MGKLINLSDSVSDKDVEKYFKDTFINTLKQAKARDLRAFLEGKLDIKFCISNDSNKFHYILKLDDITDAE